MGPVHGVTCLIFVNPQPTYCGIILFKSSLLLFAIVTTYIGQALSLKASAVGSEDHYERNERARNILPEGKPWGQPTRGMSVLLQTDHISEERDA